MSLTRIYEKTKKLPNGKKVVTGYRVIHKDPATGQWLKPQFKTREEAEAAQEQIEEQLKKNVFISKKDGRSLDFACKEYITRCEKLDGLSAATITGYQADIDNYILPGLGADTLAHKLTKKEVTAWVDGL